jgi:hypothetical protein
MNRLRIRLDDQKGFVFSAAMVAVFVLLAGGSNALATNAYTVWTVSKASTNSACVYPGTTTCNTIGSAVGVASPGDVIVVGPGKYNESVEVGTSNLSIFGAQAGRDARVDRHDLSKESIVDATGQGSGPGDGAAFYVYGDYVVIDGFTIQGGTSGDFASGIFLWGYSGTYYAQNARLVNNIIQNNAIGIDLYYYVYAPLIEYNLFKTNNCGTVDSTYSYPAYGPGYGIVGYYGPYYAGTITENAFEENLAAAIFLYYSEDLEITKNTSENDGSFVVLDYCYYTFVDHNQGQDFGAKGSSPWYSDVYFDGAIDLIYYNEYIQINDNDLEKGSIPNYNGIAFSNLYYQDYVCAYCQVSNNTVTGFEGNGIVAETAGTTSEYVSTLEYSAITGNDVEDNGNDGILIQAGEYNYYNTLFDNRAKGNRLHDCEDDTSGTFSGTPPTADTWFNNIGTTNSPAGLCTARGWQP